MSQAQQCLDSIAAYYADPAAVADRHRRNADDVWSDVILDADGFDSDATDEHPNQISGSEVAVFEDGSALYWDAEAGWETGQA